MILDGKTQYCQDISSSKLEVQIRRNPNQNPRKFFGEYQQTDSRDCIESGRPRRVDPVLKGKDKVEDRLCPVPRLTTLAVKHGDPGGVALGREQTERSLAQAGQSADTDVDVAKATRGSKDGLLSRGAGAAGHPRAKTGTYARISHPSHDQLRTDHGPEREIRNCATPRRRHRRKPRWPWCGDRF